MVKKRKITLSGINKLYNNFENLLNNKLNQKNTSNIKMDVYNDLIIKLTDLSLLVKEHDNLIPDDITRNKIKDKIASWETICNTTILYSALYNAYIAALDKEAVISFDYINKLIKLSDVLINNLNNEDSLYVPANRLLNNFYDIEADVISNYHVYIERFKCEDDWKGYIIPKITFIQNAYKKSHNIDILKQLKFNVVECIKSLEANQHALFEETYSDYSGLLYNLREDILTSIKEEEKGIKL